MLPNAVAPAATDTIENVEWYISSTGSIHFGGTGYSGSDDTTLQPFSNRVVSLDTNDRMLLSYVNTEGPEYFYNVASDYTVDLTTAADYSSASLGKLVITGTIDMTYYLYVSYKTQTNTSTSMTRYFNPESVSLLINDEVYGDPIEITSGGSVEVNWEVDLSQISNVSSYGFRFSFSGGNHSYSLSGNLSRLEVGIHWNPEDLSIAGQDVTVGLLDSILNLLRTIVSSIVNLPGNIASAIGNILQSLFVPSQEDLTGIVSQYQTLFEDRLGFIWQPWPDISSHIPISSRPLKWMLIHPQYSLSRYPCAPFTVSHATSLSPNRSTKLAGLWILEVIDTQSYITVFTTFSLSPVGCTPLLA